MSFNKIGVYKKNDEDYSFNYNTDLSMIDKITFVNSVTDYIVNNYYNYIARNLFFDFEIIKMFTDYDLTYLRDSDSSISEIEKLLKETNIVDIVKENMNAGLLDDLRESVSLNIEFKTGIHKDNFKDAIVSLINVIQGKLENVDINELVKFAGLFGEHIEDFTPQKILDAYGKSDIFKKRSREIEKRQQEKMDKTIQEMKQNVGLKVLNNN